MHLAVTRRDQRPGRTGAASRRRGGIAVACLGALLVAGCAAKPQDIISSSQALRKPVDRAMVDMPPGGPAVLGVVERTYSNATTQELTLENHSHVSGENRLTITMFGPVVQVTAPENRLNNDPLALLNVGREFGWFFPGVRMQVSTYYAQNRYGSFGYATGRSGVDTCLYAWQRIRAPDLDSTLISRQGTIMIRLRLCAPQSSETDLLQVMTGFNINAYFLTPRWNPYGQPPPPPEDLGKPGATVLPPASAYSTTGSVAPRATVRRRVVADTYVAPVAETITPDAALVPPPTIAPVTTSSIAAPVAAADPAIAVPLEGYPTVPPP